MGDFIKDLNIIDFLGMLLPGSLYIMVAWTFLPVNKLLEYFGTDPGAAVRITFLLVGGYVIGMIFHEIGDLLEKLLFMVKFLDPRTIAAKRTKLCDRLAKNKKITKKEAIQDIRAGDSIYFAVVSGVTDVRKRNLFEGFRTMARNLLLVLILSLFHHRVLDGAGTAQTFFYLIACAVLAVRYYHYSYLKFKYSYEDYLSKL